MEININNNKKKPVQKKNPTLVSTGCSNFKSYLSLCRHFSHTQPPPPPPPPPPLPPSQDIPVNYPLSASDSSSLEAPLLPVFFRDGEAAAQAYWRRARQLEHELRKLDKWLNTEKKLTESLRSTTSSMAAEEPSREDTKLMRLADGSYLHEVKKLGRPWGRLVMQLSTLTIAENSSTAFEVMSRMTSMKIGELCKCLRESMTMGDISGCRADQIKGKVVDVGSETGCMEVILSGAMDKMEGLALEGLLIQMGTTNGRTSDFVDQKKTKEKSKGNDIVVVLLIQVRDPKERYGAVGEPMIGFVEAASSERSEPTAGVGRRFDIQGVHVAGMKKCTKNRSDGRDSLWSASLKGCQGPHNTCCWRYVRNPDRLFA